MGGGEHVPVLLEEAVAALAVRPDGTYVDATFGRGGHARAILDRLGPAGRLFAFDRDPEAAPSARAIGDPRFVSSQRISPELNQLSWFSTVEYLSIILSDFKPAQIVVDPAVNYFWLSCGTATENAKATRSVPMPARDLIRIYSCLHR